MKKHNYIYEIIYKADGFEKRRTFNNEKDLFAYEQICVNNGWEIISVGALIVR